MRKYYLHGFFCREATDVKWYCMLKSPKATADRERAVPATSKCIWALFISGLGLQRARERTIICNAGTHWLPRGEAAMEQWLPLFRHLLASPAANAAAFSSCPSSGDCPISPPPAFAILRLLLSPVPTLPQTSAQPRAAILFQTLPPFLQSQVVSFLSSSSSALSPARSSPPHVNESDMTTGSAAAHVTYSTDCPRWEAVVVFPPRSLLMDSTSLHRGLRKLRRGLGLSCSGSLLTARAQ
jgi:hypothetical protein